MIDKNLQLGLINKLIEDTKSKKIIWSKPSSRTKMLEDIVNDLRALEKSMDIDYSLPTARYYRPVVMKESYYQTNIGGHTFRLYQYGLLVEPFYTGEEVVVALEESGDRGGDLAIAIKRLRGIISSYFDEYLKENSIDNIINNYLENHRHTP